MKRGFNPEIYIAAQKSELLKRLNLFDKLYLEFGGKLCFDMHATRVLPGYKKSTKIKLLKSLPSPEIIYCINARDLSSSKMLSDFKLNYFNQALKDISDIEKNKLNVKNIAITLFENQPEAIRLKNKLQTKSRKVHFFTPIEDYPHNLKKVLKGFQLQPFIKTKSSLIIITGVAGGSGKMSVALSQIYHERKQGLKTGFAKFETFPIHNLPLSHPINIAYEAATADLGDINMIDPYHKKAYKTSEVNYNRDIENFAILQKIARKLTKQKNAFGYRSPTDMGINMAKSGIIDDKVCQTAATKEIKRRMKVYSNEFKYGRETKKTINRMKQILKKIK